MRFPGIKASIGLPILLAIGIALIAYGVLRSDSAGVIFGTVDIALSVVLYASANVSKKKNAEDEHL